jgi:hypothetical protein
MNCFVDIDGKGEEPLEVNQSSMDQIQKLRIALALAAVAILGVSALLAVHGMKAGPLDEIGGGFPT